MKLPLVSLTLRVTPRLIVCRRLQAESTPDVAVETVDSGRAYGSPKALGSTGLFVRETGVKTSERDGKGWLWLTLEGRSHRRTGSTAASLLLQARTLVHNRG